MSWQELSIRVPDEYVEPISYLFSRYGRGLSMERAGPDGMVLRTYLPVTSRQRLARIEVGVKLVSLLAPTVNLSVTPIPEDVDWQNQWRDHFNLLRVGRRLVVRPSWIDYQPASGEVVIETDPGMAFGTGYHPTTYTCLEAMEDILRPGMTVLDLGTGSGILAIAASKLGASRVLALDVDPQAVRAARQNFRRARVQQRITLAQGSLPHPLARPGQFDLVVANISARAIRERCSFILPALSADGRFIASGIMRDQRQELHGALVASGCSLCQEWPLDDWVTLVYRLAP